MYEALIGRLESFFEYYLYFSSISVFRNYLLQQKCYTAISKIISAIYRIKITFPKQNGSSKYNYLLIDADSLNILNIATSCNIQPPSHIQY